MTDVYLNAAAMLRIKRRCFRFEAENPEGVGAKSIAYHQQDCVKAVDGSTLALVAAPSLRIPLNDIAVGIYTVADPVTGLTVTFSGAAVLDWLSQDYVVRLTASLVPVTPGVAPLPPV